MIDLQKYGSLKIWNRNYDGGCICHSERR